MKILSLWPRLALSFSGMLLASTLLAVEPNHKISPQPDSTGGLKLRLICGERATDEKLAQVKDFPDLQAVEAFGAEGFSDAGLVHLAALPKLRSLALGGANLTPAGIGSFRGKTNLKSLTIHQAALTLELAQTIASLPNLETLRLRPKSIEPGAWKPLAQLTKLRELDLSNNLTSADADQLVGLEDLKHLERVTLFGNGFGPMSVKRLAGSKQLRELTLRQIPVTAETAVVLANFAELQSLEIYHAAATPEALKVLANVPTLRHLGIHADEISSEELALLKTFKQLRTLDTGAQRVTKAETHALRSALRNTIVNRYNWKHNLADLKALAREVELNPSGDVVSVTMICHEPATDEKVGILHQFPAIEELKLFASHQLTDTGLRELRTVKKLRALKLHSSAITDAGLLHLQDCPQLETILLVGSSQITPAGIAKLKGLLPNVVIDVE